MRLFEPLRAFARRLVYRPYKSVDEMWRIRTRRGEWNESFKAHLFASDYRGYNLWCFGNVFRGRNELKMWENEAHLTYEYLEEDRRAKADKMFDAVYAVIKDRIKKSDVLLDVGCNTGYNLDKFHKEGYTTLWGIDPMKFAVEYARRERPYLNIVEGSFGPPGNDVICDVMVWFGSINRVPYGAGLFEAMDRCVNKYIVMYTQEAADDFNRDYHVGLGKKGFLCIEKRCFHEETGIPIGFEGADGPLVVLGDREKNIVTQRYARSVMLFRRIEPRGPAPVHQRGR